MTTDLTTEIKQRIENTIPDAQGEVIQGGNGHFSLKIIAEVFEGLSPVKQHQLVYSAFADLMSGANAPVHAIDKMDLRAR